MRMTSLAHSEEKVKIRICKVHRENVVCSYLVPRWNIPQYCHQKDEIKDLYAKDDGFLTLQSVSCHLSSLLLKT